MGGVSSSPAFELAHDHCMQCVDSSRTALQHVWVQTNEVCSNSICSVIWPTSWSQAAADSDITYVSVGARSDPLAGESFQYPSPASVAMQRPMPYLSQPRDRALYAIDDDEEGASSPPLAVPHYSYRPHELAHSPQPPQRPAAQSSSEAITKERSSPSRSSRSHRKSSPKGAPIAHPLQQQPQAAVAAPIAMPAHIALSTASASSIESVSAFLASSSPVSPRLTEESSPPLPQVPGVPAVLPQLRDRVDVRDIVQDDGDTDDEDVVFVGDSAPNTPERAARGAGKKESTRSSSSSKKSKRSSRS